MNKALPYEIKPAEFELISKQLDDLPFTVIPIHLLNKKLCRVYAIGDIVNYQAIIIQPDQLKSEPIAIGENIEAIGEILTIVDSWECVNVSKNIASKLCLYLKTKCNKNTKLYKDLYYCLKNSIDITENESVRLLNDNDLEILSTAKPELQGAGFKSGLEMLTEGVVAGAIIDNNLVAIAHTSAFSEKYADVGVYTLPDYRGQGFAKTTATLVCDKLLKQNLTPIWSCGEDNFASIKIAENLGFEYFDHMTYLICE